MKTIGLFGTCGSSRWRDDFISEYNRLSIDFYNPQVEEGTWLPEMAEEETFHFNNDDIVLFPITHETPSLGSLAETGFSVLSILASKRNDRYFIVFIDDSCVCDENNEIIEESIRVRKLVKSKLESLSDQFNNLILVDNISDMLKLSIQIYNGE